jgi:hypothetical protein
MTQEQFNEAYDTLYNHAMSIREAKQPEYTLESADVLNNFKESARRAGVTPLQVWSIFFDKQLSSIQAHIKNTDLKQAEPLSSRFADLYNYLLLGYCLFEEKN